MKKKTFNKTIVVITLITFIFSAPIAVFANTTNNSTENNLINENLSLKEHFTYEEAGKNIDCYVYETPNGLNFIAYELDSTGEKILYEEFYVTSDENGDIWIDDTLIFDQSVSGLEDNISTAELYPIKESHGEVENSNNLFTALKLGTAFYTTFSKLNPAIGLAVSLFVDIAVDYLEEASGVTAFYCMKSQLETFPTNVPSEYTGAVTRTDYEYNIYRATYLTPQYFVGGESETIYAMP